jgi:hypothetical protein
MGITGTEDAYTVGKINGDATNGLDVDVTRVIPGTAATALGKAEDAAHASGDVGVMALTVRSDTAAALGGLDADYQPLISDGSGRLHVNVGALPALPAGTNNIGDVDVLTLPALVAGTANIGDVDVLTLPALVAGTANIGDVDVLTVPAPLSTAGGGTEATALRVTIASDSTGLVSVDDNASSLTVDNAGTFVTQENGAALTALQLIDNLVLAADGASSGTDAGVAVLAVRDDALSTLTPIEGDFVPLRVNSTGALHVTGGGGGTEYAVDTALGATPTGSLPLAIRDDALSALTPVEGDAIALRVDANGALWVIPSGTTVVSGTVTANVAAGTNNIGDVDVLTIAAGDNNIGNVDVVSLPASTNTLEVVGDAAHDAAIAGNPLRIAARGMSADYTAVATGDTADLLATLLGKQVVYPYALPGSDWHYAAASGGVVNTTGVTVKAAVASVRNYVTRAEIINGHATVSTDVQIRDGASGTVLWRGFAQAAGGGVACVFDPPLRGTANTLLEVACGTTGSATYFNLHGFAAAE